MKNFKLLLATTAILSAGALMANAVTYFDGETESVQVRAELIKAHSLKNTQPLDFGRIIFEAGVYEFYANMDSSGNVTPADLSGGDAYVHTQGKVGIVTGATCDQLEVTYANVDDAAAKKIDLTPPSGKTVEASNIVNLTCLTDGETSKFYGVLNIVNLDSEEEIPAGVYTGSFTVTAIYPEETTSGNTGGTTNP